MALPLIFQCTSEHEKLRFDCAGVDGLHVDPARGNDRVYVFCYAFQCFCCNAASGGLFITFGKVLGRILGGFLNDFS